MIEVEWADFRRRIEAEEEQYRSEGVDGMFVLAVVAGIRHDPQTHRTQGAVALIAPIDLPTSLAVNALRDAHVESLRLMEERGSGPLGEVPRGDHGW